jgi:hypothetical protein
MKKYVVMTMVLIGALCLVGSANAELIVNGENWGVIPQGWNADFNTFGQVWIPHTGVAAMHPGASGGVGGEYQDIATVIGQTYEASLWVHNFAYWVGSGGQVKVLVGNPGTDTYTFENGIAVSTAYSLTGLVDKNFLTLADGNWSQVSFQFSAVGTTTRFGIYSNPIEPVSIDVDDVSVTEVPEPATLALLGLGSLLLRKRR